MSKTQIVLSKAGEPWPEDHVEWWARWADGERPRSYVHVPRTVRRFDRPLRKWRRRVAR